MNFYIQVWPNNTATLMLENGTAVWTYPDVASAEAAFNEWHSHQHPEQQTTDMLQDPTCAAML